VHNETLVLEGYVEELYFNSKVQLAFDYVAMRDIQKGEPLYLDYGPTWEYFWRSHWADWQPVAGAENYIPAIEINYQYPDVAILTEKEQQNEPYGSHLEIRCHHQLLEASSTIIIPLNASYTLMYHWQIEDIGRPCRVISRSDAPFQLYDVLIGVLSTD
jgi:hypothetical protein